MPNLQTVTDLLNTFPEGRFFSVTFVKRTTGELRTMQCRQGVKKHLKGGTLNYSPNAKGLISVWSPDSIGNRGPNDTGYRMIPADGIRSIRADGREWEF